MRHGRSVSKWQMQPFNAGRHCNGCHPLFGQLSSKTIFLENLNLPTDECSAPKRAILVFTALDRSFFIKPTVMSSLSH